MKKKTTRKTDGRNSIIMKTRWQTDQEKRRNRIKYGVSEFCLCVNSRRTLSARECTLSKRRGMLRPNVVARFCGQPQAAWAWRFWNNHLQPANSACNLGRFSKAYFVPAQFFSLQDDGVGKNFLSSESLSRNELLISDKSNVSSSMIGVGDKSFAKVDRASLTPYSQA